MIVTNCESEFDHLLERLAGTRDNWVGKEANRVRLFYQMLSADGLVREPLLNDLTLEFAKSIFTERPTHT